MTEIILPKYEPIIKNFIYKKKESESKVGKREIIALWKWRYPQEEELTNLILDKGKDLYDVIMPTFLKKISVKDVITVNEILSSFIPPVRSLALEILKDIIKKINEGDLSVLQEVKKIAKDFTKKLRDTHKEIHVMIGYTDDISELEKNLASHNLMNTEVLQNLLNGNYINLKWVLSLTTNNEKIDKGYVFGISKKYSPSIEEINQTYNLIKEALKDLSILYEESHLLIEKIMDETLEKIIENEIEKKLKESSQEENISINFFGEKEDKIM